MSVEQNTLVTRRRLETPNGPLICRQVVTALAEAEPVVLLHGIQGTSAIWLEAMKSLGQHRHVLAPDLRGRGGSLSPTDAGAYSLTDFAGDLAELLAEIGRPVRLVGWSMGVSVALEYLRSFGTAQVSSLVLVSGSACLTPGDLERGIWFEGATEADVMAEAAQRAEQLGLAEAAIPLAAAGAWRSVKEADFRALLPELDLPVLVMHGSADVDCPPSHGAALAAGMPRAEFELWERCGHVLMAHDPDRFARRLALFWEAAGSTAEVSS